MPEAPHAVIKQTSRQVKEAYRKNGGRPTDWDVRHLERHAAADRRAEELRARERKKKDAKKRREEKARNEREARFRNGIGDATQACGWNFTQRRQKNWFRAYLGMGQTKPAAAPPRPPSPAAPESPDPFRSSQISMFNGSDGGSGDEVNDGMDGRSYEREEHANAASAPLTTAPDSENLKEFDAGSEAENNVSFMSGAQPVNSSAHEQDDGNRPEDNSRAASTAISSPGPGLISSAWVDDDVDDEALLAAVQEITPQLTTARPAIRVDADDVDGLPTADVEVLQALESDSQIAQAFATPSPSRPNVVVHSDRFSSSQFDLSTEEMAAFDALVSGAQPAPAEVVGYGTGASANQARALTPYRRAAASISETIVAVPDPPAGAVHNPPALLNTIAPVTTGVAESRFAAYGLSTQIIEEAIWDDSDD